MCCDSLFHDYKKRCFDASTPFDYQLRTLVPIFIGQAHFFSFKKKAAESGVVARWACDSCGRNLSNFEGAELQFAAGKSLQDYFRMMKNAPFKLPWDDFSSLVDSRLRHLHLMELSGSPRFPKEHQFVHLTLDMRTKGNARMYSTFTDESINLTIAKICSASHRATWERNIFQRLRLLPMVSRANVFAVM